MAMFIVFSELIFCDILKIRRFAMDNKLTIQEQIDEYLSTLPEGAIITTGSFKKILSKTYGQSEGSYIPSDYCYNSYCKDSQWDKQKIFYFEKLSKRGQFKYLGKNYSYTGKVFYKNNSEYGEWNNGIFTKTSF